jgi:isopenicillin N synthase-like dioxygenase
MEDISTKGFLHLKNIDGFDEDRHLAACKAFHAMPEHEKHKMKWKNHNPDNLNIFRGLAPFVDNDPSHKELYDMGCDIDIVSEEERQYCLYERTPFPEAEEYQPILD